MVVDPNPEVSKAKWAPMAAMILAGYLDGAAKSCRGAQAGSAVSTDTKHGGKVFGACSQANLGVRNGLLRVGVPGAPLDDTVRALDTLNAIPKTRIYGVNQMHMEREMD